ncbi:TSUP family transporter [Savagea sp. SN6]|uniref:Probable membrane transporter protein n=1 Tax=Savagea serpentis TaxID=2785297 RepID=A0A8J7GCW0_9BACL|nr:TSUP family transporter [Savagea serpentis]MBF4501855.1 TSUP family transporter [Savagea serpentis]
MLEDLNLTILLILIIFGFLAAFVDSVVGGGGLITLPALLFTGISPTAALATNKLASSIGSFTSSFMFLRSGHLDVKSLMKLFPLSFFGAMLGAYTVSFFDPNVLKPLMLIMLAIIAVYTLMKKDWGSVTQMKHFSTSTALLFAGIIAFIGFYDGFLGPGTGSFLMFALLWRGFDFLQAAGNAKVLNFGSNFAALLMFMMLGEVLFVYGLIMGAAQIIGSIVGSRFAMKRGSGYVRILFIVVTVSLLAKQSWDYVSSL